MNIYFFLKTHKEQNKRKEHRKNNEKPHHFLVRITYPAQEPVTGPLQASSAKVAQESIRIIDWLLTVRTNICSHLTGVSYHR
jgi:hypothetical protein